MSQSDDKAAVTQQIHAAIRSAVANGHMTEATRLADHHKISNAARVDLGVLPSDDPAKAPDLPVG